MEFAVVVVNKVSKNGKPYTALEITFPSGYKKLVFLSDAEKYLVSSMVNA